MTDKNYAREKENPSRRDEGHEGKTERHQDRGTQTAVG